MLNSKHVVVVVVHCLGVDGGMWKKVQVNTGVAGLRNKCLCRYVMNLLCIKGKYLEILKS